MTPSRHGRHSSIQRDPESLHPPEVQTRIKSSVQGSREKYEGDLTVPHHVTIQEVRESRYRCYPQYQLTQNVGEEREGAEQMEGCEEYNCHGHVEHT